MGLGVALIILPGSFMGNSEDLFGVIVLSEVILFLEDVVTDDISSFAPGHHVKESPKNHLKFLK